MDPIALERFLMALPPDSRENMLKRFLRPESLPGKVPPPQMPGSIPPPERVGSVRLGAAASDLEFDDPELDALFQAVFRPRRRPPR